MLFKPNAGPQTDFLASSEREVLYGGAAGGGKSFAMLADPLRGLNNPNFSGLLVRHTTEELRELIQKSQELYPKAIPGIKWSERKSQWVTPKGGRLWMSYLDRDLDVMRYQGQAFNWIGFDELTQWATPYAWDYMRSRLRSADQSLGLYMRATTNPGYEAVLLSLPEHQRKQLLEGNWDVAEGAAFPEFDRSKHVVEPYKIPSSWRKFRACDYGYGSYSAVVWLAVTPSEQLVVYRELQVSKVLASDLADKILQLEAEDGTIQYGVLDSSLWHKRGDTGPSLAEQMIIRGCKWRPSDRSRGSRIAGKNELHRRLQVDEYTNEPRLVVFNNCTNLISQLPSLPLDKKNNEDVDTNSMDHMYDALRYGIMTRPRSSIWDYNPVNQRTGFQIADPNFGY